MNHGLCLPQKKCCNHTEGFSIIEVLISMLILSILVAAFTPLFLYSVNSLKKAGTLHQQNADDQGKMEIVMSTGEGYLDENGEYTEMIDSAFPVRVSGAQKNIDGTVVEAGDLKSFVSSAARMIIAPDTINEGYANDTLIAITGENTHFINNHSKLEIRTADKTLIGSSYYLSLSVSNAAKASFMLKQGLTSSQSPYLITVKTGSETVSATLTIDLPNMLTVGERGTLLVSAGVTNQPWTVKSAGVEEDLFGVSFKNQEFLTFGALGTMMTSPDTSAWRLTGPENTNDLFSMSVRNSDRKAIITGKGATILISDDDSSWSLTAPATPLAADPALITWLKADALSLSNNTSVSTWYDSSGINHATAQGSVFPKYITNVLNGKPVVRFNGENRLSFLPTTAVTDDFTVVLVAAPTEEHEVDIKNHPNGGKNKQHFVLGTVNMGKQEAGMGISMGNNGVSVYEHGDSKKGNSDSGYFPAKAVYGGKLNAFNIITVKYMDKRPQLFVNGALVDNDTEKSERTVYSPVDIGGTVDGSTFTGDIAEILIYDKVLSETERTGLEAYLHKKYSDDSGSDYLLDSLHCVWSDGSVFYAVGSRSHFRMSADALTWESQPPLDSALNEFNAIAGNDDGVMVIVGNKGKIFVKEKNKDWKEHKNVTDEDLNSVVWTGTKFIAVGASGTVICSGNGNSWSKPNSKTNNKLNKVVHHSGKTVAVGDSGIILWSSDHGSSWNTWTSGTNKDLYDIMIR